MKQQDFDITTKVDILKHIYLDQRNEINHRREREYKIFTWSSSLLLALIGALLITQQNEQVVWVSYGVIGNLVATVSVIFLVVFSMSWQYKNIEYRSRNAKILAHVSKLLHFFDKGFFDPEENSTLLPQKWASYGSEHLNVRARFFRANYATATFLLGCLAILMIWLP